MCVTHLSVHAALHPLICSLGGKKQKIGVARDSTTNPIPAG